MRTLTQSQVEAALARLASGKEVTTAILTDDAWAIATPAELAAAIFKAAAELQPETPLVKGPGYRPPDIAGALARKLPLPQLAWQHPEEYEADVAAGRYETGAQA
jgi:hypothetical protein